VRGGPATAGQSSKSSNGGGRHDPILEGVGDVGGQAGEVDGEDLQPTTRDQRPEPVGARSSSAGQDRRWITTQRGHHLARSTHRPKRRSHTDEQARNHDDLE